MMGLRNQRLRPRVRNTDADFGTLNVTSNPATARHDPRAASSASICKRRGSSKVQTSGYAPGLTKRNA